MPMDFNSALEGELGLLPNAYGGLSSEISITVEDMRLNRGKPTNIPTLVRGQEDVESLLQGAPVSDNQKEIAIQRALMRMLEGQNLPSFASIDEAVSAAIQRSRAKQITGDDLL